MLVVMEDEGMITDSNVGKPLGFLVLVAVVVAVVVGGGVYYLMGKNKSNVQASSRQLFKDSQMYQYAYQIFPGAISDSAKQAMAGFMTQTQTQSDGTVKVTMTATNPEYKNQEYTVKPGETLYFIEKSPGDDSAQENTDRFLRDDTAVVVDSAGYEVN